MLLYNTEEYVWPHAVLNIKRKLKGIFVNFHHFESEALHIQFAKALIQKGRKRGSLEKRRGLFPLQPELDDHELAALSQVQSLIQFLVAKKEKKLCRKE